MAREFSVRVPSVSRAPRASGMTAEALPASRELPPTGPDGDVRAKAVYALAERRRRRERRGQPNNLVVAAIQTLRSAAGPDAPRRAQERQASEPTQSNGPT